MSNIYWRKTREKNFWGPNLDQTDQNRARNQVFCYFLKFGSLVFLEIAYIDVLQKCLTSNRGKTLKKNLARGRFGLNGPKSGPKLGLLSFSQVWFISFSGNCIG